jgi:predicted ATPase
MRIEFSGKYKLVTSFIWDNIAQVAIVTGPNGVGKSQLLALIESSFKDNRHYTREDHPRAIISGVSIKSDDVSARLGRAFYGGFERQTADVGKIRQMIDGFYRRFLEFQGVPEKDLPEEETEFDYEGDPIHRPYKETTPEDLALFHAIVKNSGKAKRELNKEDFLSVFPLKKLKSSTDEWADLSSYFFNYRLTWIDEVIIKRVDATTFYAKYGEEPWKILQRMIEVANLPYRFTTPEELSFRDEYSIIFFHKGTNDQISHFDFSSGEQVIMDLVMLLHNSREFGQFPKLLLLDEPDAHLHPAMIKQFLDVVTEFFAKELGIRIIITTHSPTTVALAKVNGSCEIYEIGNNPFHISQTANADFLIERLSEGLVIVRPSSRIVIVEGKDDVPFYTEVFRKLKEMRLIPAEKSAIFLPGQGKESVIHWANKLNEAGLQSIISGIVDRDHEGPDPEESLEILDRASIENYLLDPIIVFATMLGTKKPIKIEGIEIHIGEETRLASLGQDQLQTIANEVISQIKPFIEIAEMDSTVKVQFVNDVTLEYPEWLLRKRGKDLMGVFQQKMSPNIKHPNLIASLKRTGMIPVDLLQVLQKSTR